MPAFLLPAGGQSARMIPPTRRSAALVAPAFLVLACAAFWAPWYLRGNVPVPADQQSWMLPWAADRSPVTRPVQWQAWWWDGVAQFYPWRAKLGRELAHGRLPLWNEQQFCGYPFAGNGQSAIFYPPNWLYAIIPARACLVLSAMLHHMLAALLTFAFLRVVGLGALSAVCGGLVYALGGPMIGLVPLPTMTNAAAWLPGCLLGVELVARSRGTRGVTGAAVCGGCAGMSVLAGHLQIAAYVLLATALYAAARWVQLALRGQSRIMPRLAMAGVIALGLAAVQLLPGLELAGLSPRGGAKADASLFEFHRSFALHPAELITLAYPDALGHPARGDYPLFSYGERAGFAGLSALVLAVVGLALSRRWWRWAFLAAAILVLWAAMAGLPARLIFHGVPGVGLAGGFVRLLFLYVFALAVISALGLQELHSRCERLESHFRRLAPALAALPILVLCAELFGWGWLTVPSAAADRLYPDTQLTQELQQDAHTGERLLAVTPRRQWTLLQRPRALMPPNSATAYPGLESVQGYDSLYPRACLELATMIEEGATPSPEANGNMILLENADSPLLRLAGVRWVLSAEESGGAGSVSGVRVDEQPEPFPRAFVTRLPVEDPRRAGRTLARLAGSQPDSPARVSRLEAGSVSVETPAAAGDRRLVVTNTAYPGWRGWQDGEPAKVFAVGGVFQGMKLRPGARNLFLAYWPGTVVAGLFLHLLAAGTLAGLLAFDTFRRREARQRESRIG